MKRPNLYWIVGICAIACLLGAAHWLHIRPIYAQQDTGYYDDGTFYISSWIDVDSSYNLSAESYMQVDFDLYGEIDEIEVDAYPDEDDQPLSCQDCYADGDDWYPADLPLDSSAPVPPGHEYGLESDGWACYDDGEGDCYDWESINYAYASVYVSAPLPQIASLSTYSVNQGDQNTLTVTGSNFIEYSGDQLTLNFSGGSNPFTLTSTPSTCTSTCTATFSYNFSGYPAGSYTLSVSNNEGSSNNETFTVNSPSQNPTPHSAPDPCAVTSSPQVGFSSFVSTGTTGGTGNVTVSFSGTAFAAISPTVTYGPYSTPSSIASNIAALISRKYLQYGLSAKAFGPMIVYGGTTTLGTVSVSGGPSFSTDTSSAATTAAAMACYAKAPFACLGLFPDYDYARNYNDGYGSANPKQHIINKHILGTPTAIPPNTVYVNTNGLSTDDMFLLVKAYNFVTVLEDPFPKTNYFQHTYPKATHTDPITGVVTDIGFIGIDASGKDLYTNLLRLSPDRCKVITSYPVAP